MAPRLLADPDRPGDPGDGVAAHPDRVAPPLAVHPPGPAKHGALRRDVRRGEGAVGGEPLGEPRVEAAGDRVLRDAEPWAEGPQPSASWTTAAGLPRKGSPEKASTWVKRRTRPRYGAQPRGRTGTLLLRGSRASCSHSGVPSTAASSEHRFTASGPENDSRRYSPAPGSWSRTLET